MSRHDEIRSAYRALGQQASFYDGMITCSTFWGRLICKVVWNMDEETNLRCFETAFSGIPEDFSGRLLEVPVGTGVLSMPVYKGLKKADITCLDYSADMMAAAERRAGETDLKNIRFVQGDVGALPFPDASFDLVLSLNGFHAFPLKDKAYRETLRVLKPGGTFCGCFYISGENRRTDWFIRNFYIRSGFFTPPFETLQSLTERLSGMYAEARVEAVEGIGCFVCKKAKSRDQTGVRPAKRGD